MTASRSLKLETGPIRIGVVGCGRIARLAHLPALARLDDARVVAVVDPDPTAVAAALRLAPAALALEDLPTLLEHPGLDAIVICSPSHLHADAAVAALARGLDVYVEKPLASTLSDARRIETAWRDSGQVAMTGFNLRFHPLYRAVADTLARGSLGTLAVVRACFASAPRQLSDWQTSRTDGGGALLTLAVHQFDLVRFLFGEVRSVSAALESRVTEDDTAVIDLALESGLRVQCLAAVGAVEEDLLELYGERGKLVVDRYRSRRPQLVAPRRAYSRGGRIRAAARLVTEAPVRLADVLVPPPDSSHGHALAAFVAASRERLPASPGIPEGTASLALVEAAERSAATGARVELARTAVEAS